MPLHGYHLATMQAITSFVIAITSYYQGLTVHPSFLPVDQSTLKLLSAETDLLV